MKTNISIANAGIARFLLAACLALAVAFAFSCSEDDDGHSNNGGLFGKWYSSETMADAAASGYDYPSYEFKPDGKGSTAYGMLSFEYTATANTITITMSGVEITMDYTISGNELTIAKRENQPYAYGLSEGTFYRGRV